MKLFAKFSRTLFYRTPPVATSNWAATNKGSSSQIEAKLLQIGAESLQIETAITLHKKCENTSFH